MSKYLVVYERADKNYSAFCPDLPGCIATGSTKKEVTRNIKEAIAFHLEGLRQDGVRPPAHHSSAQYIAV